MSFQQNSQALLLLINYIITNKEKSHSYSWEEKHEVYN